MSHATLVNDGQILGWTSEYEDLSATDLTALIVGLENVGSYNIELDVGDRRGYSSITLRGVPVFLIDAFNFLRLHGLNVEGIFRKEGNVNRLKNTWQTYFGCVTISEHFTTHDVCSLIKRFFREIKIPIFAETQSQLIEIALSYEGSRRVDKLLEAIRSLPAEHLATLTFLMRQLKYFGEHHEQHQMTIENLARVFSPTLFRDDVPTNCKKKKGSQENVISAVRNENELRTAIVIDLIDNAPKIGVPRDYYVASRCPSDLSQKMFGRSRIAQNGPLRSISAKPTSRSSLPKVKSGIEIMKEKRLEKRSSFKTGDKSKGSVVHEKRSSSTVREIFSSISNKVLRRALSPLSSTRRRESAEDVLISNSKGSADKPSSTSSSPRFCVRVQVDDDDDDDDRTIQMSPLSFKNEEGSSSCKSAKLEGTDAKVTSKQREPTPSSHHRSRRESPRKHINTNSRSGRATAEKSRIRRELKQANVMLGSPALEPAELVSKRIGDVFVKCNDDRNKIESKILKRNSSKKKILQPVRISDSTFHNEQNVNRASDRIHRRHTAPVKTSSTLLKRNQPNTVATGLKTPNFRLRGSLSVDNKSKQSEASEANSNEIPRIDSDEENDEALMCANIENSKILELKGIESRQRRAKRQKRRDETLTIKKSSPKSMSAVKDEVISLLEDVNSEITRLEEYGNKIQTISHKNVTADGPHNFVGFALDAPRLAPPTPPCTLPPSVTPDPISAVNSPGISTRTPPLASVKSPSLSQTKLSQASASLINPLNDQKNRSKISLASSHYTRESSNDSIGHLSHSKVKFPTVPAALMTDQADSVFKMPISVCSRRKNSEKLLKQLSMPESCEASSSRRPIFESLNDDDFKHSEELKRQILCSKTRDDMHTTSTSNPFNARPSVLSINTNNRGMVKQRVNLFAKLGTQTSGIEEADGRSSGFTSEGDSWMSIDNNSCSEFVKPSAPPASHGIRSISRRRLLSPPSRRKVSQQARKFEAKAIAALAKSISGGSRNRKKVAISHGTPVRSKLELRRLSGERREKRLSRSRLDCSLGRLASRLMTGDCTVTTAGAESAPEIIATRAESSGCQRTRVLKRVASRSNLLKDINPRIVETSVNLHSILETSLDA